MELKSKSKKRWFRLKNSLLHPNPVKWTDEVINSIEIDELLVFDPKDKHALNYEFDETGAQLLLNRAKVPISITEWLTVGCQCIRWWDDNIDGKDEEDRPACYSHNAAKVLWPASPYVEFEPEGPCAFVGEIIISNKVREETPLFETESDIRAQHKFKFLIAHELVHVFDYMRFIVPAFMDWRSFWRYVLDAGTACDILWERQNWIRLFIDSYGQENELAMVESYWPSYAKIWFDAFRPKKK